MQCLFIVGAGGFGTEVIDLLERYYFKTKAWDAVYVIDDHLKVTEIRGIRNFGTLESLLTSEIEYADIIVTINNCEIRKNIVEKIKSSKPKFCFPNIFSQESVIDFEKLKIGEGNIIMHYVAISTNITIGSFNIFNSYTGLGHDTVVRNLNTFNPRVAISGNVSIGDANNFGLYSSVLQNLSVGSGNSIWVSSVVMKNLKDGNKYFGIPAKKLSL